MIPVQRTRHRDGSPVAQVVQWRPRNALPFGGTCAPLRHAPGHPAVTRFAFTDYLKTAKALELTIPPALLLQADQILE